MCWYHFRLVGETFIETRSVFGAAALASRAKSREPIVKAAEEHEADRADWQRNRSVVYYVRLGDHVKIGYTINLGARINGLRVDRDALLAVEPGWREVEDQRHEMFAAERQGRRENFNPSRRLLLHIEAVRARHGDPWEFAARRVKSAGPRPLRQSAPL